MEDISQFGPKYPKINSVFKRDTKGNILLGEYSDPAYKYLEDNLWSWSEKIDGCNIRLYWNTETVTIGGRTDNAQIPAPLMNYLQQSSISDVGIWKETFDTTVTIFGEGYGAGIQSGGLYRSNQSFIVFDILIGDAWLSREDVEDVAKTLGFDVVPLMKPMTLLEAMRFVSTPNHSLVPGVSEELIAEGLVGEPAVRMFDRRAHRIRTKLKYKDLKLE